MNIPIKSLHEFHVLLIKTKSGRVKTIMVQVTCSFQATKFVRDLYPGSVILSHTIVDEIYNP